MDELVAEIAIESNDLTKYYEQERSDLEAMKKIGVKNVKAKNGSLYLIPVSPENTPYPLAFANEKMVIRNGDSVEFVRGTNLDKTIWTQQLRVNGLKYNPVSDEITFTLPPDFLYSNLKLQDALSNITALEKQKSSNQLRKRQTPSTAIR